MASSNIKKLPQNPEMSARRSGSSSSLSSPTIDLMLVTIDIMSAVSVYIIRLPVYSIRTPSSVGYVNVLDRHCRSYQH